MDVIRKYLQCMNIMHGDHNLDTPSGIKHEWVTEKIQYIVHESYYINCMDITIYILCLVLSMSVLPKYTIHECNAWISKLAYTFWLIIPIPFDIV